MKPHLRLAVILATILAMALAYLGGTFVSAQTSPLLMSPGAPAQTTAQRVRLGDCLVAVCEGRIVGTVTSLGAASLRNAAPSTA